MFIITWKSQRNDDCYANASGVYCNYEIVQRFKKWRFVDIARGRRRINRFIQIAKVSREILPCLNRHEQCSKHASFE